MRIAIASGFAYSLSWWCRLVDEGNDVRVWVDPAMAGRNDKRSHESMHVGDGLVDKELSWERLLTWAQEGVQSGIPTMILFDASGHGEKADEARKLGIYTVGGGGFMDRLENDRSFGFDVAEEVGANLPPFQHFDSIQEARKAAESIDEPTFFKSDEYISDDDTKGCESAQEMCAYLDGLLKNDVPPGKRIECMLQSKIEGVAISTERWWNGRSFTGPYLGDIEHKALMNDDIGPSTGCSFNATWFYDEEHPQIARLLGWERLVPIFLANEASPGIYDMNAVVDKNGDAWFLEWTPRLGYDSEMTNFRLVEDLTALLWAVATGQGGTNLDLDNLAYSLKMAVPPYPWEWSRYHDKDTCLGHKVDGADGLWDEHFIPYQVRQGDDGLEVASTEGIVGLSLAVGPKLSTLGEETVEYARELRKGVKGLMFRTDGAACVADDAKAIGSAGVALPAGLLE